MVQWTEADLAGMTGEVGLKFCIMCREEKFIRSKVFQMMEEIISAMNGFIQREMNYVPKQPKKNSHNSSQRYQHMSPRQRVGLQKS